MTFTVTWVTQCDLIWSIFSPSLVHFKHLKIDALYCMLQYCIPLSLIYVDVKYFPLSLQVDSETRQEMHTEPRFNQEAGKKSILLLPHQWPVHVCKVFNVYLYTYMYIYSILLDSIFSCWSLLMYENDLLTFYVR